MFDRLIGYLVNLKKHIYFLQNVTSDQIPTPSFQDDDCQNNQRLTHAPNEV